MKNRTSRYLQCLGLGDKQKARVIKSPWKTYVKGKTVIRVITVKWTQKDVAAFQTAARGKHRFQPGDFYDNDSNHITIDELKSKTTTLHGNVGVCLPTRVLEASSFYHGCKHIKEESTELIAELTIDVERTPEGSWRFSKHNQHEQVLRERGTPSSLWPKNTSAPFTREEQLYLRSIHFDGV